MDEDDVYYKAMLSRDYRFDGKFYIGVKTTGIYCRPICPAKPKRKNIEFFKSALSAEKAGYRPCQRCHPEYSPQSIIWPGKSPIVQKALQLISQNIMFDTDIESFAKQLDVSSRHLRRLFDEEIGLSPKQISDIHRLNFAYKLTCETHLPLIQVALASGFSSLRRFNDAFKKRYHKAPHLIRKAKSSFSENKFNLNLSYRPPFDWDNTLNYYLKHRIPFIETVSKDFYQRIFKENSSIGIFTIKNNPLKSQLEVEIFCQDPKILFTVVNRIRKMFDLNSDPVLISNQFEPFPFLKSLIDEFPGLRIASGWDPFEIAVGTILGQVVSVNHASNLMGEIVRNYGEKIIHPISNEPTFLFPSPEILADASLEEIKTTQQRKHAIRELSKAIVRKEINFLGYQNFDTLKQQFRKIKGIGAWSAEYICLRALSDTNAFPKDDLVLSKALKSTSHHFDLLQIAPWRGYLAVYLWKKFASLKPKESYENI